MKAPPRMELRSCYGHYCRQAGLGPPFFEGGRFQRGSGLIQNFASKVIPYIKPFVKEAALSAGRYLLSKGGDFLSDIEGGANLRESAKRRFGEIKSDVIDTFGGRQRGSGGRKKRRRLQIQAPFPFDNQTTTKRRGARTKNSRAKDIFT